MEFIDKNNYNQLSQQYTNFENGAWNEKETTYHGYCYDNLDFKGDIKIVLSSEQDNKCCYCMGDIDHNNTTLEHIYPQRPSSEDNLQNYGVTCIDTQNFDYNNRQIPNNTGTNLPHDISYYNLVASCNSTNSCNNKRGNQPIKPLFFDKDISSKIQYDENGNIMSMEYEKEIKILGLANSDLIKIRKLWYHCSQKFPQGYNKDDIKSVAFQIANRDKFYLSIARNDKHNLEKTLRYSYFFDKYK